MSPPVVLAFGVILLGYVLLYAVAWALPASLLAGYGYAWAKRDAGGSRAARLVGATGLGFLAAGLLSTIALFVGMSGDAGHGVRLFGAFALEDMRLLAPLALAPVIIVAGEVALRRAKRALAP